MDTNTINIFNRSLLTKRYERHQKSFAEHNFLHERLAQNLADRLLDVNRRFKTALCLSPHHLIKKYLPVDKIETLINMPFLYNPQHKGSLTIVGDETFLPFQENILDLVLSNGLLHWTNDIPGALRQVQFSLKPDGFFIANFIGYETLKELREIMMEIELEMTGGASPRISPFMDIRDAGALLQRAGFALPVTDRELITIDYKNPFDLLRDLQGMGASNARSEQNINILPRQFFPKVMARYQEKYGTPSRTIPVTVEIIYMSGWKPDQSQQKPLRPGSAKISLTEIIK